MFLCLGDQLASKRFSKAETMEIIQWERTIATVAEPREKNELNHTFSNRFSSLSPGTQEAAVPGQQETGRSSHASQNIPKYTDIWNLIWNL